jgi:hypothetical protein
MDEKHEAVRIYWSIYNTFAGLIWDCHVVFSKAVTEASLLCIRFDGFIYETI